MDIMRNEGNLLSFTHAWIATGVLQFVSIAVPSITIIFCTIKISKALRAACEFLIESTGQRNRVQMYEKIIRFSNILCCIFSIVSFCAIIEVFLKMLDHIDFVFPHLQLPYENRQLAISALELINNSRFLLIALLYIQLRMK